MRRIDRRSLTVKHAGSSNWRRLKINAYTICKSTVLVFTLMCVVVVVML